MKYRVCVIGAGGIAQAHLRAAQAMPELEIAAVSDTMPERLAQTAHAFAAKPYTDYQTMIVSEKPDIAVVALPPYLHMEAAVCCANQGVHVLLEKPMAMNTKQCDEIIASAARNRITLMIGHTVHYLPSNRKVKQLIDSEELGKLVMINDRRYAQYFDHRLDWFFRKEMSGGGILMNLGSHSIDKLQWFTGSKVTRVKASADFAHAPGNIEGAGAVFAETASGVPGLIFHSGYGGVNQNETELIFTEGIVKLDYRVMIGRNQEWEEQTLETNDPYELQFKDMIRSMETGVEPECSGTYARSVIQAVEAVYRSIDRGVESAVSEHND